MEKEDHLQSSNGIISVQTRHNRSIGDKVIDTSFADNLGSISRGLLEGGVLGEVALKNVNIGRTSQLLSHSLLRRSLVANQTDDQIIGIFGELLDKFKLERDVSIGLVQRDQGQTHSNSPRNPGNNVDGHVW